MIQTLVLSYLTEYVLKKYNKIISIGKRYTFYICKLHNLKKIGNTKLDITCI